MDIGLLYTKNEQMTELIKDMYMHLYNSYVIYVYFLVIS